MLAQRQSIRDRGPCIFYSVSDWIQKVSLLRPAKTVPKKALDPGTSGPASLVIRRETENWHRV
jgi:hypothetical protein